MNKTQSNAFNMFESVLSTMNANKSAWNSNVVISGIVGNLQSGITSLLDGEQNQKTGSEGVTQTKTQARISLEGIALGVSDAGKAYAVAETDLVLKAVCNLTSTKLIKAKDVDLIALCQNVYDAASPIVSSLIAYGTTAANVTALQTAITNFTNLSGQPASAMQLPKVLRCR